MFRQNDNHNSIKRIIYCRAGCGSRIYFDDKMLSKNGISIPLEDPQGIPHECPLRNLNEWKPNLIDFGSKSSNIQSSNKETKQIPLNAYTPNPALVRLSEIIEYPNKQNKTILTEDNHFKNQLEKIAQGIEELKRIQYKQE